MRPNIHVEIDALFRRPRFVTNGRRGLWAIDSARFLVGAVLAVFGLPGTTHAWTVPGVLDVVLQAVGFAALVTSMTPVGSIRFSSPSPSQENPS